AARPLVDQAFVDEAVAVVVLAVADLRLGPIVRAARIGRAARRRRPGALDDAWTALADPDARLADGEILVDHAVAIVVDAVAQLGLGVARYRAALADAVVAHEHSRALARADAHRARLADVGGVVVDEAVAVVVDAVAHLGRR